MSGMENFNKTLSHTHSLSLSLPPFLSLSLSQGFIAKDDGKTKVDRDQLCTLVTKVCVCVCVCVCV